MRIAWVVAFVTLMGCNRASIDAPHDDLGQGDDGNGGSGSSDAIAFGEEGGSPDPGFACVDTCVPSAPAPFLRLTMLAVAPPEKMPACPDWAPVVGFEGFAGIAVEPHTCPACACSPASCALPETIEVSTEKCGDPGDAATLPFDPPGPGWEGVCTSEGALSAGLTCEGEPCVQSVTVSGLAVSPCKPFEQGEPSFAPPSWEKMVRECLVHVDEDGGGCPHGKSCAPVPPDGFALCVFFAGADEAYECPDEYPRRVVVSDSVKDERACSPCACGAPEGTECAALVTLSADAACASPIAAVTVSPGQPACVDVPSGVALGSKEASFSVDETGKCAPSGGQPVGEITPAGPVTFCCQPDPALPR